MVFEGDTSDHYVIDRMLALSLNVPGVRSMESRMTIDGRTYSSK